MVNRNPEIKSLNKQIDKENKKIKELQEVIDWHKNYLQELENKIEYIVEAEYEHKPGRYINLKRGC